MNLYHLEVRDDRPPAPDPWSDNPQSILLWAVVVRAEDEEHARHLASNEGCAEQRIGFDPWLDAAYTRCVELTAVGPAGVILTQTTAG